TTPAGAIRRISRRTSSCTTPASARRAAARSTATPASASVPPTSTRWWTPVTAPGGCRSTRRTACTARRATSWIPTRSSTGFRPKEAAVPSTKACDRAPPDAGAGAEGPAAHGGRHADHQGPRRDLSLARRRPLALRRDRRLGQTANLRVLARTDSARDPVLARPRHRRHDEPELRRRVDCGHHRALRVRDGARVDLARRRAGAGPAAPRSRGRPPGGLHDR